MQLGPDKLDDILPRDAYHVYAVGTQECERTISQSVVFSSKERWERSVTSHLGSTYHLLASKTLQAVHLMALVHVALLPIVSDVQTAGVACGIGNALGNKGGVGIAFNVGKTALLFINSHLAAHQNHVTQRNRDALRIERVLPLVPAGYGLEARLMMQQQAESYERAAAAAVASGGAARVRSPAASGADEGDEDDVEDDASSA
ncbi:hypothetical protein EON67_04935, partial [archaeon]